MTIILSKRFENKFRNHNFLDIIPGYAGILTLAGEQGWVEIV